MMNKHFSVILATVTGGIAALFTFYTALRLHNAGLLWQPSFMEVLH